MTVAAQAAAVASVPTPAVVTAPAADAHAAGTSVVYGPHLTLPASEATSTLTTAAISGITLADAFAAGNPGQMALTVWDGSGTLSMHNAAGGLVGGSGKTWITYNASYASITAALSSLTYTAGANGGSDTIGFSLYDQAGRSTVQTIAVSVATTALPATMAAATLNGTGGPDLLYAGPNEVVNGGGGSDTYVFGAGDGATTIDNGVASTNVAAGEIKFAGLTDQQLWLQQSGKDLVVDVLGSGDRLTVSNWFAPGDNYAEVAEFDAGSLKLDSQVNSLVQAMATFSGDNAGFNPQASGAAMPADATLQAAIATAWHR